MPLSLDELKKLLDAEEIRYFQHPAKPVVLAGFGGLNGSHQITISLYLDGHFLQFRTMNFATCKADNANLAATMRLLMGLNLKTRWVKWCWDQNDGEVCAMGDMWVADGGVTRTQLQRMLGNILPAIDVELPRIKSVIDTGKDPGEIDPAELMKQLMSRGPGPAGPGSAPTAPPKPVTEI